MCRQPLAVDFRLQLRLSSKLNERLRGNMTVDQGIGLAAIIITVIIAAFVTTKIKKRNQTQHQSVGKGGMGIQSGRDTSINK